MSLFYGNVITSYKFPWYLLIDCLNSAAIESARMDNYILWETMEYDDLFML